MRLVGLFGGSFILFLLIGLWLTRLGTETWDAEFHLIQGRWLVAQYFGLDVEQPHPWVRWYGPFWELILGLFSEGPLRFLNDPTWARYSVNFTLLPLTLMASYWILVREGVARSTAFLSMSLVVGLIRLGGHSITNTKDYPLACFFLLITLVMWVFLREIFSRPPEKRFTTRDLWLGTFLSLVPYLVRPPALLHFAVWWGVFVFGVWNAGQIKGWGRAAWTFLKPFLTCIAVNVALYPAIWELRPKSWAGSIKMFSNFPLDGTTRVLGQTFSYHTNPWWYPLAWVPVNLHPYALFLLMVGGGFFLWKLVRANPFRIDRKGEFFSPIEIAWKGARRFQIPMSVWIACFGFGTWLLVFLKKPALYDESRHVLFLFPLVLVAAGLGLDKLQARVKVILAVAVLIGSGASYARWGKFSYVYKSPLIPEALQKTPNFLGDYWGMCVNPAVRAMHDIVPSGETVVIRGPLEATRLQAHRLRNSRFSPLPEMGQYRFVEDREPQVGEYILTFNRNERHLPVLKAIEEGRAEKLWEISMPPGEMACLLAKIVQELPK